ncbi:2-keto-myo-inositol dehydratase [Murinocardiopsis flavida]|uniref:2-keto-myo-inositol dehydratase n=1 Tax=Murinocardiopsis flavida TaxID=645275 RepID=A0A2P8DKP1_9ACTN|nr:sugar phosphate isomerase/epimerase [Murinocardiopsis flavida]PSK97790.1 2-keto-myo-inositol dehydratase [Murinocardiopsis flavida]
MPQDPIRIGNAPVSYGMWSREAAKSGGAPDVLLRTMADAGYAGSELGPVGLFGDAARTAELFASCGMSMIGAYVPIRYPADDAAIEEDFAVLEQTCAVLDACGGGLVILADETEPLLDRNPAHDPADTALAFDAAQWDRCARLTKEAMAVAEGHGLPVSFHPHMCTHIESAAEIERLCDLTDVPLTLDIGHARLAGDDPVALLRTFADRINHVHIKDVRMDVLRATLDAPGTAFPMAEASVPLGAGDVDLAAFTAELGRVGYDGWLVVEQDRDPDPDADYGAIALEQGENLRVLRELLAASGH